MNPFLKRGVSLRFAHVLSKFANVCICSIFGLGSLYCAIRRFASDGHWDRVAPALDWYARALMESTGVRSQNAFSRPTTGFIALLVALHSCDTVTLYGYGMSPKQPCPTYRVARQDAQGGAFLNASHCRGFGEYTRNGVHNYAAEQAWLHAATSNYTRTTLTCEDLPLLVTRTHKPTA